MGSETKGVNSLRDDDVCSHSDHEGQIPPHAAWEITYRDHVTQEVEGTSHCCENHLSSMCAYIITLGDWYISLEWIGG